MEGKNESKHTPGPWTVDDTEYCQYVFGPEGEMICEMRGWGYLTGNRKGLTEHQAMEIQAANCKLIASAPALLEENEKLKKEIDRVRKNLPPDNETVEDGGGCFVAGSREQLNSFLEGPYVDFNKPNIFIDGDFNNSYSLMTSSDPELREKGKRIRIHELSQRNLTLKSEVDRLTKENETMIKLLTIGSDYLPNGYVHHKGEFFDYRGTLNDILTRIK